MFCSNCGSEVQSTSKFCPECGGELQASAPRTAPPPDDQDKDKKKGGGFLSSPGGIALIVILAVAVLAGITLGIVFLVKGDANGAVDAQTAQVWEEYESMVSESNAPVPAITVDQAALTKTQEDLKKTQERVTALEAVLKKTGGSEARRTTTVKQTNKRDVKADELAAALAAYNQYVQKMTELFGALNGANLLDPTVVNKLNQILAELQKLGNDVKTLSGQFLANNGRITMVKFDPPILKMAVAAQADIQKNVTASQDAEKARLEQEKAAADKAAADAEAQRQAQEAAAAQQRQQQQTTTLDASRCPNGDPYCPI